jgi:2-phosphoglycolate phosphatase
VIKAILFDLDGTLLDSAPDLVATLNHLRMDCGLHALPIGELRHFVSRGAIGLIKAGMPPCDDETLALWRDSFLAHYKGNSYNQTRPFDGVESLLSELDDSDIPWGIVTNKMESLSMPILEKTGWLSSASTVICGDTVSKGKPHPEPVLAACSVIGLEPEQVLMVGDDMRDIEAGKRAGCHTAFALYGYAARETHPDIAANTALINSPKEVLDLLTTAIAV